MKFVVLLSLILTSCSTTITCSSSDKLRMALLDHGKHSTLIIQEGKRLYRYGYGDWNYYALGNTGLLSGAKALFWPTPAGLGREILESPMTLTGINDQVREGIEEVYFLNTSLINARRLRETLDKEFYSSSGGRVVNSAYGLTFVSHLDDYWIFNNSNGVMAKWLNEAGCDTQGISLFSRWEVEYK